MSQKFICIISVLMMSISLSSRAQIIHLEKSEGGFWIKQGETKVLFFQREMNDSVPAYARNNYFHPVYDLKGRVITEDFPEDHLHHRGIFWAWHQILIDGEKICDPWDIKNFEQKIRDIEFRLTEKNNGELKYNAYWYTSDNTGDPFMQIKTKVTVHSQKIRYRRVDFRMVLQPLEYNLSIGGSDNVKGYGGFSFRMATNKHTKFYNDAGDSIIPQNTAMDAGAFVNIINPDHQNGVVIFNNPRNPEISGWILRQDDSAQNCAWPGRVPVKLNVEQPVTLQYSILIHNGKLKNRAIQRILSN